MISLLMPTMNRSDFVERVLSYYAGQNFRSPILIADSSNREEFEKTVAVVKKLDGKIDIKHLHYPGLGNYAAVYQLMDQVTTPYSTFLPDDDFFVPNSLKLLTDFLEKNPGYSCAWGKSIQFILDSDLPYGRISPSKLGPSNQNTCFSINQDSAKSRLLAHGSRFSSVFTGCCRTEMFKNALRCAMELHNIVGERKEESWQVVNYFSELIVSFDLVIQGKIKSLDCLHFIRQSHNRRYQYGGAINLVTSPYWSDILTVFSSILVNELKTKGKVNEPEAKDALLR